MLREGVVMNKRQYDMVFKIDAAKLIAEQGSGL